MSEPIYIYAEIVRVDDTGRFHTTFTGSLPAAGDVVRTDEGSFIVDKIWWQHGRDGFGVRCYRPTVLVKKA